MFGKIKFEEMKGLTMLPQKAASAWVKADELVGAKYTPLIFVGTQSTKGVNYWFIAEQTLVIAQPEKRIVKLAICEFEGKFEVVSESIEVIFS